MPCPVYLTFEEEDLKELTRDFDDKAFSHSVPSKIIFATNKLAFAWTITTSHYKNHSSVPRYGHVSLDRSSEFSLSKLNIDIFG